MILLGIECCLVWFWDGVFGVLGWEFRFIEAGS